MLEGNMSTAKKWSLPDAKLYLEVIIRVWGPGFGPRACRPRLWGIHLAICELSSEPKPSLPLYTAGM